jgi:geranylgeranyl pyrophosphate synthase
MVNKKIEKIQELFRERGSASYEIAKLEILKEKIEYKPVYDALRYFIEELWHNFHHPALLSLTCEVVGGKPENTTQIGAALVLLTGAADIHDDIIDKSLMKASKPTVLGKFGVEIALLTGDALFLKGCELLHNSCNNLAIQQKTKVTQWIKKAFFDLGVAVAKETSIRGNWNITPKEYLDILIMKAAIAEATARIGAFIGGGSQKEIKALEEYGQILGTLANIRDDFIDVLEPEELQNRVNNECIPLPLLYALQNQSIRDEIIEILEKGRRKEITDEDCWKAYEKMKKSPSSKEFNMHLNAFLRRVRKLLRVISDRHAIKSQLLEILDSMTEDILL